MNGKLRVEDMFPDHEQLPDFREVGPGSMLEGKVGISEALRSVLSSVRRVAPMHATLLISDETGTGKELVARAIHRRSNRASRACVSVNESASKQASGSTFYSQSVPKGTLT